MKKLIYILLICSLVLTGCSTSKKQEPKEDDKQTQTEQKENSDKEPSKDKDPDKKENKDKDEDQQEEKQDDQKPENQKTDNKKEEQKDTPTSTPSKTEKEEPQKEDLSNLSGSQIMDKWISENISAGDSQSTKINKIINYVVSFRYNYDIDTLEQCLQTHSGECWTFAELVNNLCARVGIVSGYRTRGNELPYPDYHLSNYVVINGVDYVLNLGRKNRANYTFYQCPGFSYSLKADGTAVITDYEGFSSSLTIPSTIGGYEVSEIAAYAIQNHFETTSVYIPGTVKVINDYAFKNCTSLSTVQLPSTIEVVSTCAFDCDSTIWLGNTPLNVGGIIYNKSFVTYNN